MYLIPQSIYSIIAAPTQEQLKPNRKGKYDVQVRHSVTLLYTTYCLHIYFTTIKFAAGLYMYVPNS